MREEGIRRITRDTAFARLSCIPAPICSLRSSSVLAPGPSLSLSLPPSLALRDAQALSEEEEEEEEAAAYAVRAGLDMTSPVRAWI
jgi:hypothetical protein